MFIVIVSPVYGAKIHEWILSSHFHNVDFPTGGPSHSADARAEHPECRPDALTLGHLDAGFHPCVDTEGPMSPGIHTSRRVGTPSEVLPAGFDNQHFILNARVHWAIGVVLQLIVTKSTIAKIEIPSCGVDRRPIELVRPN